jgi:hypothetical protein
MICAYETLRSFVWFTPALQDDQALDGITLLADPGAVKVSEWVMHHDASQLIAL